MSKNGKAYLIALPISLLIDVYLQYNTYLNYNELQQQGIVTNVNAEFTPGRFPGPHYYKYQFSTVKGETIYRSGKIGSQKAEDTLIKFNKQYKDLQIIYNPEKPNSFWEYKRFINYPKNRNANIFIELIIASLFIALVLQIPIKFIIEKLAKKEV